MIKSGAQRSAPTAAGVVTASWDKTARVWDAATGASDVNWLQHNGTACIARRSVPTARSL